ncbi:MAG: GNAT family N-acetyltransferase [Chloroflexota bacterium]|nr:GNAT family N-acetyltransferase [Chloroflexota bacterium]
MSIDLRPLRREELTPAASVAARALRDNPINRAIFGDDPRRRLTGTEAAFRALLPVLRRPPLGAYQGGTLVGIIGVAPPGTCVPSLPRQLRMLPPLLRHGLGNLARESLVLNAWARHDPRERHWHLDPVAVEPGRQGLGIGTRMMARFCLWMDSVEDSAYLETDKPENVAFYQKFGFVVVGEVTVLGTATWLMQRPPRVDLVDVDARFQQPAGHV